MLNDELLFVEYTNRICFKRFQNEIKVILNNEC